MKRYSLKALAVTLSILIAISVVPFSVFADEVTNNTSVQTQNEDTQTQTEEIELETNEQLEENTENTKPLLEETVFSVAEPENGKDNGLIGEVITTEDGFRIQMNADKKSYSVISYIGSAKNVTVPSVYLGLPVNRIRDYAFRNKKNIVNIVIPDSILRIDEGVFDGCSNLKYNLIDGGKYLGNPENKAYYFAFPVDTNISEFTIKDGTRLVGSYALYHCENLTEVTIPDSVIQIGYNAVGWCDNLNSITLPFIGEDGTNNYNAHFGYIFGARTYGGNLSYVPVSLKNVVVNGGKRIAKGALYGVDQIEKLTVPFLGNNATDSQTAYFSYFWNADSYKQNIVPATLADVTVNGGVMSYGAFYLCVSIINIELNFTASSLGNEAFYGCSKLENIVMPKGITGIGNYAFYNCAKLKSFKIPEGVTTIGPQAFRGCSSLKSINIPNSVTSIGTYAFNSCGISEIYIEDIALWCNSLSTLAYNSKLLERPYSLYLNGEMVDELNLPDTVTSIADYSFYYCVSITEVNLTEALTSIGKYAFSLCSNINSVTLPKGITAIGSSAFNGCNITEIHIKDISEWCNSLAGIANDSIMLRNKYSLYLNGELVENLVLPQSTTTICNYAFRNCNSIKSIEIPGSVTSIKYCAFYECNNLTHVKINEGATDIGGSAFYNCTNLSEIILADSITSIGSYAFSGCSKIKSINIPSNIVNIYNYAFEGCQINEIHINDIAKWCNSVSTLAYNTGLFRNEYKLFNNGKPVENIILPDNVVNINDYTFYNCTTIKDITVPDGNTNIGKRAFYNCRNLENVILPDSVTNIGDYAFYDCSNLISIDMPSNLKSIGNSAFEGCINLTDISIPQSVTTIGKSAFSRCSKITNIILPNNITAIGSSVFYNCSSITSIEIPEGVTSIGGSAFSNCTNLVSVLLPESLTSIGGNAFYGCSRLKNIIIPEGVTSIGAYAFYECKKITDITIPKAVTSIGNYTFYYCENLANINIPDNLTSIGTYAFYSCKSLTSITIPQTVTSIGGSAFYGCSSLACVILPEGLTIIGSYAFYTCSALTRVTIPSSVTSIGNGAFMSCLSLYVIYNNSDISLSFRSTSNGYLSYYAKLIIDKNGNKNYLSSSYSSTDDGFLFQKQYEEYNLIAYFGDLETVALPEDYNGSAYKMYQIKGVRNVIIPDGVSSIPGQAFADCSSLEKITLPESVKSIGNYAFKGCSNLASINIPNGLITFNTSAFSGCSGLNEIKIAKEHERFTAINGIVYNKEMTEILYVSSGISGEISIPETITTIPSYAFEGCSNLTGVTLPESITYIGRSAFEKCSSLTKIILPDSLTSIDEFAFSYCVALKNIVIPDSVTSIGRSAFSGCTSLENISLPKNITSIESSTFEHCESLEGLAIPSSVTNISGYAFRYCSSLKSITLPESITNIPPYTFLCCTELTNITIPKNVTSIGDNAFYGCSKLTDISLPDGVTVIGNNAFQNCNSLVNITIPENVNNIGNYTFYGCVNLTEINLPNTITSIGSHAFYGCSSLAFINIPDGIKSINNYTFYNCKSLYSITLPDSVTSIGSYAFDGCDSLKQFIFPKGVTVVNDYIFNRCTALVSVYLPMGITSIGNFAFSGCSSLESINLVDGITNIGSSAFSDCSSLKSIKLPKSIVTIDNNAFNGCNITEIYITDITQWCDSLSNIAYKRNLLSNKYALYLNDVLVNKLILPEGITAIKDYAFYNCVSLTDIVIPQGVVSIGNCAFLNCENLKNIALYDGLTNIGDGAFENCISLVSINIPNSVTSLGRSLFYNCSNLGSVILSDSITSIPNYAFYSCSNLKDIVIPDGVTIIGSNAFNNCTNLTNVVIPDSVISIDIYAFNNCSSIKSISLPEGITSISNYAFYKCKELTNINIPSSVSSIGDYAFSNCNSLTSIVLPKAVNKIGSYAFMYCNRVTDVTINSGNISIGSSAFYGCDYLYAIYNNSDMALTVGSTANGYLTYYAKVMVDKDGNNTYKNETNAEYIKTDDGFLFKNTNGNYQLIAYIGNEDVAKLPESINGNNYEIYNFCGAENIILPKSILTLSRGAFSYILKSIDISYVQYIESGAFTGCYNLNIIYNGELNEWRHLQKASDWDSGLNGYTVSYGENSGLMYEANEELTEFYASGYRGSASDVSVPEYYSGRPVTKIYDKAFYNNSTVKSIILPETVTDIGDYAFSGCSALETVNIPSNVNKLSFGMFDGCESLKELTLPFVGSSAISDNTSYIGYIFGAETYIQNGAVVPETLKEITVTGGSAFADYAFWGCTDIEKITLSDTITDLGAYSFSGCSSLESFVVPHNVTVLKDYLFSGCSSLKNIELGNNLNSFGSYVFSNCLGLSAFDIPDSVVNVGTMIFDGCSNIKNITIGAGLTSIADQSAGNPLFGINKVSSSLSKYTVSDENTVFATDSYGILYKKLNIDGNEVLVTVMDAPATVNLQDYILPDYIVEIAPYAFAYNATLLSVNLEYVRMIDSHAFYEATGLVNVTLGEPDTPDSVFVDAISGIAYSQYIGDMAFKGCSSLLKANIETDMLIGIGEQAFADCPKLKTVIIGKNIQKIGLEAFSSTASGLSGLEQIQVSDENKNFKSIAGVLYSVNNDGSLTLFIYPSCKAIFEEDGKMHDSQGIRVYPTLFVIPDTDDKGNTVNVSAIESFAFESARYLDTVVLDNNCKLTVGDYAFAGSKIQSVTIGKNVVSLGIKRGEGEYTVFDDCDYLTEINLSEDNDYYSSENGVLYDKNKNKLIKYPASKTGESFIVPDSVTAISSMAFKNNTNLRAVKITSYISSIGLEAFYHCSNLEVIFFDSIYAPTSVMENAFTTWVSIDQDQTENPETTIGFSSDCYLNGNSGEYGWINYADTYSLATYESMPELDYRCGNGYYAVVVVDSEGNRLENISVSLTDPRLQTETIVTDSNGIVMFYDLFGKENLGFGIDYDLPYSIKATDISGVYYTFLANDFYLDSDMRITYITLVKIPVIPTLDISGVSCDGIDINSQTANINKAMYGKSYDNITLKNPDKGYTDDNIILSEDSDEIIEISVIGYYDTVDCELVKDKCMLYQNGVAVSGCTVSDVSVEGSSATVTFAVAVSSLISEVPLEARLAVTNGILTESSVFLNVNVINFSINPDDVNIETGDIAVDLKGAGDVITKLFGTQSLNFSLGKNFEFATVVDNDKVTLSLNGAFSAEKEKKKDYGTDYKKGYDANHKAPTGNTFFFKKKGVLTDKNNVSHTYTFNIRFARGTEKQNYYYYRCYIYEKSYNNQKAVFYGVVNAKGGRVALASKASQIYLTYLNSAKSSKDITKGKHYVETVKKGGKVSAETSNSFEAELYGDIVFQYQQGKGLVPVTSLIKGELKYSFSHKQQFIVWIIPVSIEISVDLDGTVYMSLKFDENRAISLDEAKMTINAEITAKLDVGCSLLSAGVYGTVGTVFVLEFYPEFEVEKWTVSGKLAAFAKFYTLKWKKGFLLWYPVFESVTKEAVIFDKNWTIIDNTDGEGEETVSINSLYLANAYTAADSQSCQEKATLFELDNEVYKIFYKNLSSSDGYDEYNYMKLAISHWDSSLCKWSEAVIIDDNGYNDFAYEIYKTEDGIIIVYTQQTEKTNKETAEDSYEYVSDLSVKFVIVNDLIESITPETVVENSNYKYLSTTTQINGINTVLWVENSDNNMFGVSPYNYIDANGTAHIFTTTANSIWMSQYINNMWTEAVCVIDGLAPVTKLVATNDGYVAYIIDTNCNIADSSDRTLFITKLNSGEVSQFNLSDGSSINDIKAINDIFLYSYSGNSNGVAYLDLATKTTDKINLPDNVWLTEDYRVVDYNGKIIAFIYTQNKSWNENGKSVDGSAVYGIFRNENEWGKPIEIASDLIYPVNGNYIYSYDAIVNPVKTDELILTVECFDSEGTIKQAITDRIELVSNVSLDEYSVDYENKILTVKLTNKGAVAADAWAIINGSTRIELCEKLLSGYTDEFEIPLSQFGLTPSVTIYNSVSNQTVDSIGGIDLNYSDLKLAAKQISVGNKNILLVAVKNFGNLPNNGVLYVKCGNQTVTSIKDDSYSVVVDIIAPGTVSYYEIPLENVLNTVGNTVITMYIEAEQSTEKGNCSENNIVYATVKDYNSKVNEDGSSYYPSVDIASVEFDSLNSADIHIPYSFPLNNKLSFVELGEQILNSTEYTLVENGANGTIIICEEYLNKLEYGQYPIYLVFENGYTLMINLNVTRYCCVTWADENGEILLQEKIKAGNIPLETIIPEKPDTDSHIYSFVGWDSNADGNTDALSSVISDVTYRAVFKESIRQYKIVWLFETNESKKIEIEEFYSYGETPNYLGEIISPDGKYFYSWDKNINPVTNETVYAAIYAKSTCGSAIISNSGFEAYKGKEFSTVISLNSIDNIAETDIRLTYDTNLVKLLECKLKNNATISEQEDGNILLHIEDISASDIELAELNFIVLKTADYGEKAFVTVEAVDNITNQLDTLKLFKSGDVNGDGKVDIRDLVRLKKSLSDNDTVKLSSSGDFDCDRIVNACDISLLRKFIVGSAIISNLSGDTNGDDVVDQEDIDYLNRYLNYKDVMISAAADVNLDDIIDNLDLIAICRMVYSS